MSVIIDVTVNFKPHTELKLYEVLGVPKDAGKPIDPEAYIAEMDKAGVAMAGLVSNTVANGVGGKLLQVHVDDVYPVLQKYPDRFFGWCGINPLGGMETVRYIDRAVTKLGFTGVHVYPHWFGVPINDRIYYPFYAKCCELGVPITLQVGKQSPRSGARFCARPSLLEDVAFDFPELKLIGLHIGVPYENEMTGCVKSHENVSIIADAHPPSTWSDHFVAVLRAARLEQYRRRRQGDVGHRLPRADDAAVARRVPRARYSRSLQDEDSRRKRGQNSRSQSDAAGVARDKAIRLSPHDPIITAMRQRQARVLACRCG